MTRDHLEMFQQIRLVTTAATGRQISSISQWRERSPVYQQMWGGSKLGKEEGRESLWREDPRLRKMNDVIMCLTHEAVCKKGIKLLRQ